MLETTIGEVVARQFDRVWDTLRDALSKLSDEEYRTSDCEWLAPIRLAYHVVETAEFYTLKNVEDGSPPLDWDNGPAEKLPAKEELLAYLERVQPIVRTWLTTCSNEEFLSAEPDFNDSGGTRLDRMIYSLRHAQHHVGQINAELRRRGLPRGKWG
jgi:uncharacterized damage-inducible protein DinB